MALFLPLPRQASRFIMLTEKWDRLSGNENIPSKGLKDPSSDSSVQAGHRQSVLDLLHQSQIGEPKHFWWTRLQGTHAGASTCGKQFIPFEMHLSHCFADSQVHFLFVSLQAIHDSLAPPRIDDPSAIRLGLSPRSTECIPSNHWLLTSTIQHRDSSELSKQMFGFRSKRGEWGLFDLTTKRMQTPHFP